MDDSVATEPTANHSGTPQESSPDRLRIWPAVVLTIFLWGFLIIPNQLYPESPRAFKPMMLGMLVSYVALMLWWVIFSGVVWRDRFYGMVIFAGGLVLASKLLYHPSIVGIELVLFVVPCLFTLLVATMLVTKPLNWQRGRLFTLAATFVGLAAPALIASNGANSGFQLSFRPRWQPSTEEQLLASLGEEATTVAAGSLADNLTPDDTGGELVVEATIDGQKSWPGFRGPNRDGRLANGSLTADWNATLPTQIWRRDVGPGWSSFCIVNGVAYTQEQRGNIECVVAYDTATGDQMWSTGVETRFEESMAGPGPRATPTYFRGDLYAIGGSGVLQRLDADSGATKWKQNAVADAGLKNPPEWGIASSPLLVLLNDGRPLVVVYVCNFKQSAAGTGHVIAYDASSGEVAWTAESGYHSYSSPHMATLHDTPQILMATNAGLESHDPDTGDRLWFYAWDMGVYGRSIQPTVVDDHRVVLSGGYDSGTMLVSVEKTDDGWSASDGWEQPSHDLEPYFNDMVLYEGHLYGISKKYLVCINLETGKPTWPRKVKRKAKFGNGQIVLDPAAGMLLVTTEDSGEALLIEANPETLVIKGRLAALRPERNWNHPVVADGRLYVRHGSEAACYQLPAASGPIASGPVASIRAAEDEIPAE